MQQITPMCFRLVGRGDDKKARCAPTRVEKAFDRGSRLAAAQRESAAHHRIDASREGANPYPSNRNSNHADAADAGVFE